MEAGAPTPSTAISAESVITFEIFLSRQATFLTADKKRLVKSVCWRKREFGGIILEKICLFFLSLDSFNIFLYFFSVVREVLCSLLGSCVSLCFHPETKKGTN